MPLSWNEIRDRAHKFSKEWADETSEDAEAKSFWDAFFHVFGVTRRRVASFETPVKKSDGKGGFIDLLWKGVVLVEHKSRGKDLDRAFHQGTDYFYGLKDRDLPRYVLVSDFARLRIYDLDEDQQHEFPLKDLHKNLRLFGFIAGYQTRFFGQQDPVNIRAAEKLGKLHDLLKAVGYTGHPLEKFLVRLLFCLFAEDNAIFERQQFRELIELRSAEDGSDLAPLLANLFQVLNTPHDKRLKNLDEQLAAFAYINGRLFEEQLPLAAFDRKMRETLLECGTLDWSRISPAIFGALFQSIMDADARRNLGAHYTTETNILKALKPLFLDSLRAEFERLRRSPKQLIEFHKKLGAVRVLDPACGCGNFLVIAYRELRLLELDVLRELYKSRDTGMLDVASILFVDVDQFFGIEIEEFPAEIAQVALWMTDHQMNLKVSEEFGQYFARLPLKKAPNIVHGNALTTDWQSIVRPSELSFIVGNPPFVGKHLQSDRQKEELLAVLHGVPGSGVLDYVAGWYRKAADYMELNPEIRAALVSTNSITQGEQVSVLWPQLFARGIVIHFAHRTFQWSSEARGRAAVHCVIVGFSLKPPIERWIFDYDTPKSDPHAIKAANINAYLIDAPDVFLPNRTNPIAQVPNIVYGSKPTDGGNLLLDEQERADLVAKEPGAATWIRSFVGADEFLYNLPRYCLWLKGCPPSRIKTLTEVRKRVEAVKKMRLASKKAPTRELANFPTLFGEIRQPSSSYLLVPAHTSESRPYIPFGYMSPDVICGNANFLIPDATLYHFGVIQSLMHMAWVRAVSGRLESRYRYSAGIVYNNFPWPQPTSKQQSAIEKAAQGVLDARAAYPAASLADLYDPVGMPPDLVKAHRALDRAVDAAYNKTSFSTEAERVAFLFDLYRKATAPLMITPVPKKRSRTPKVQAGAVLRKARRATNPRKSP